MKTNKYGLPRTIPEAIKREVRQRAGFGCINCGCAIYEYDHLDPQYFETKEHNADNIILLCAGCHTLKTNKLLSIDTLKRRIKAPKCKELGFSFGPFDIGIEIPKIKLCSISFVNVKKLFRINGDEILSIRPPEFLGQPFLLNAFLTDRDGNAILSIKDNEWRSSPENWDVQVVGQKITIRKKHRDIILIIKSNAPHGLEIEKLDMTHRGTRISGNSIKSIEITTPAGSIFKGSNTDIEITGEDDNSGIDVINGLLNINGHIKISGSSDLQQNESGHLCILQQDADLRKSLNRNSLCFCNSSLRYKQCCGKIL